MEAPRESPLPNEQREALRTRLTSEVSRFYNPYVHLLLPAFFGIAVIAAAVLAIQDLHPLELLTIPIVYVLSSAVEWRAHRDLLHKRSKLAPQLYDQHTPRHHMLFITDDMAVRSTREWRYVLIPAYGIIALVTGNTLIASAIWYLGQHNVAALYLISVTGFVLSYEWLHLSYHLPHGNPIGELAIIKKLRRHHALHHDPRNMQRWNFNVTVPLWDFVRGTVFKEIHPKITNVGNRPSQARSR
jgi:hypothetical protein